MDYYSAMKKKEILSFVINWMVLEDIILSGINQTLKDKHHFFLKIWNASQICMSSLCRDHANLLCIFPILVYVLPKRARQTSFNLTCIWYLK